MARVKCPHCFHVNPDQQESCEKCGAGLPRISIEARSVLREGPPGPPGKSQLQFRRGQVVAGRYTVLNMIGQGGMGSIYKVHDNTLGEDVALKTLLPQFLEDKVILERFYNEAKIARRLAHPNIVRVHDIGEDGKILYISMEYLQGMSLREMLDNLRPGERLPITQTLRVFDQLCSALEYAHQFTIHRDIKPENVMLGQDGCVRLMDFGISKLMANTRLTNASVVMGTPFYMSPEQIRNSRDVDARADVYSVGVMLYEILTGSVPTGVPKPASEITKDVPPALDKIVAKCVEPDPRDRYQSAAELRQAFQPVVRQVQSGISGSKTSLIRVRANDYSPQKILGGLLTAAIIAFAAWGLYGAENHRRNLAQATPVPAAANGESHAASVPEVFTMEHYIALMDELVPAAKARGGAGFNGALGEGDLHWANALQQRTSNPPQALESARRAVQCFLAPLMTNTAGMVFVPPGSTIAGGDNVEVPGFFIDQHEVTVSEYRRFVESMDDWGIPAELADADDQLPISGVTCIDAMAYAAWRGAQLPTEAQWARAAAGNDTQADFPWGGPPSAGDCNAMFSSDAIPSLSAVGSFESDFSEFNCYDMIGNVSEWTRTAEPPLPEGVLPTYQTLMVTKGGNASREPQAWTSRFPFPFKEQNIYLGFRCVLEIPDDPQAAYAILQSRRSG